MCLLLSARFPFPLASADTQSIDDFISQIQASLEKKDIPEFLNTLSPEIRKREEVTLNNIFKKLGVDNVSVFKAGLEREKEDEARVYLRVLFENSYSVTFEVWHLTLAKSGEHWIIKQKNVAGDSNTLYRIKIPAEKVERVKLLEVKHEDVTITFKNALLYYDNIPQIETALLVIGKGDLIFSPSVAREKHQLEMIFHNKVLKDRLEYAYLRFSNSFFNSNVKITKEDKNVQPVSESENNEALSLFKKHYPGSFTVEDSLTRDLLSFLPQGDGAIFEFKGKRIGDFSYIYSPFSKEEVTLYQIKKERIISLYSPNKDETLKKMFVSVGKNMDVKHYNIEIDFNPKEYFLSGKVEIEIKPELGSLDVLKFKLNPDLEILRINDVEKHGLFYTRDKLRKNLYIYLLHPLPTGVTTSIEMFYRGMIMPPKLISDVVTGPQYYDEAVFMIPPKYNTYLYSKNSFWYPAPADDDYFTARLKIIIPPQYSVVSNGLLTEQSKLKGFERVEQIDEIGSIVSVFEANKPLKYLTFIVGEFEKIGESENPFLFQFFRSKDIRAQKLDVFSETKNIFQFYEEMFGPYPYEKLNVVQRFWKTSGGHSPASFIVLNELPNVPGRGRFVNVDSPVDLSRWKEYFLAHEIAHQWWGQGVTWEDYQDQWISEGIAQFSALLYLKKKHGEKIFRNILKKLSKWTEKKAEWGPITLGARISYFDIEAYQAIVYGKACLVLNMLRDLVGDELFFQAMRGFFNEYGYKAACTGDFLQYFQEISRIDLTSFFNKWFESHILPEARIKHTVEKGEKGFRLSVQILQQKGPFIFPLWIEWRENGKEIRKKIRVAKINEIFDFEMEHKPEKIKINPDKAVPGGFY